MYIAILLRPPCLRYGLENVEQREDSYVAFNTSIQPPVQALICGQVFLRKHQSTLFRFKGIHEVVSKFTLGSGLITLIISCISSQ